MSALDYLEGLINQLARTTSVSFYFDEMKEWPATILASFISIGIIKRAEPAKTLICDGCEEMCLMPVHLFPAIDNRPARAFIACDKRNDIGRVPVSIERTKQWYSSHELLARTIAKLLGMISDNVEHQPAKNRWAIGSMKGKKHNRPLFLSLNHDDLLHLSLAGHVIPVIEIFDVKQGKLAIKEYKLIQQVDNPDGNDETSREREKRISDRIKALKRDGVKNFLQKVAKEEGVTKSRIQQILKQKTPNNQNSREKHTTNFLYS